MIVYKRQVENKFVNSIFKHSSLAFKELSLIHRNQNKLKESWMLAYINIIKMTQFVSAYICVCVYTHSTIKLAKKRVLLL